MQSSSSPRHLLLYLLLVFSASGLLLVLFALISAWFRPSPSLPAPVVLAATATATTSPSATATTEPTATVEVATQLPPTPAASPTFHYVVPANPTPRPTPELLAAAPFPSACDGPGRMNILLIGVDGRSTNYARAARADAVKVLGVNFTNKNAQMLSIPRDLWVQIAGDPAHPDQVLENRINTAFAWGQASGYPGAGPGLLSETVSRNFGIRIDRFVVINFGAFEQAVDAVGGIDIDVPKAIHDEAYPAPGGGTMVVDIPAGPVHMDGATALIYARTRHQDSDFGRMWRQQAIMLAIRDKVLSPEVIPYVPSLTQLLLTSIHTNLSLQDIGLLGCIGPQIGRDALRPIVIDGKLTQPFITSEGAYVLLPVMDAILPLLADFNAGE